MSKKGQRIKGNVGKRLVEITRWLNAKGIDVSNGAGSVVVAEIAEMELDMNPPRWMNARDRINAIHHRLFGTKLTFNWGDGKVAAPRQYNGNAKPGKKTSPINTFYQSAEWRKLRYSILKNQGGRCELCNASKSTGAVMHVDHIKPLKRFWHLRLDPDNLQVLCEACNHGKGSKYEDDWRERKTKIIY